MCGCRPCADPSARYLELYGGLAKKYHGKALAVVSPGSTEEVVAVMKAACTYKVPVVTQGGNTGLSGGATPDDSTVNLSSAPAV